MALDNALLINKKGTVSASKDTQILGKGKKSKKVKAIVARWQN